jgi:hypothetical protein
MPRVGFETTIPVFKRAKIFHALDRGAAMIGQLAPSELKSEVMINYIPPPTKPENEKSSVTFS